MSERAISCIGLSTDDTFAYSVRRLQQLSKRRLHVVDLTAARYGFSCSYLETAEQCAIQMSGSTVALQRGSSCYQRYIAVSRDVTESQDVWKSTASAEKLVEILLDTDFFGRTVNPLGAGWCNGVRGVHYQHLRKFGLLVPDYVVTNNPDVAREFIARHADVIVKSSGHHRTVVREINELRLSTIDRVTTSPCVFQVNVRGPDVRVHVVDDRCFAVRIESPETDYRYVARRNLDFSRVDVPKIIADRCVDATQSLGLQLAGIDFKVDPLGEWNCLEVNPMPGYSGYDPIVDGAISSALVDLLER
jgi:hypothetical protein